VYGTPTGPDLTQASWFRAEDKQAAKAAAETLKFAVIDIQTDAEKALTVGVHEGVLKGSGRMIVGSVSIEVYRRIEDYVRKASGDEGSSGAATIETAAAKPASEQTMNIATASSTTSASPPKTADAASPDSNAGKVATSSTPPTAVSTATVNKPESAATSTSSQTGKPDNATAPPDPWDALGVGSHVVGKYWLPSGEADGWWVGVITGIDKNDFIIRWPDEPKTPPLKIERKHVAILHPAYDVAREWVRRR
jgi:hypothetical protein